MLSLDDAKIEQLILAGKLHDIGIIGLDARMMPDVDYKMSEDVGEYAVMQNSDTTSSLQCRCTARSPPGFSHTIEQPDGKGYPGRLSGVDIPLESHIIHVANDYDLLMDKHGQEAHRVVLSIMGRESGSRYHEKVLDALRGCIDEGRC